ncbi:S24 family peptidase [Pseudomonas sp. HK3]
MTETTEFTTRLIKAIDSIGPKSLTEKTSIASSMIHRYKKGNEITLGNFKKIYQATGFSPLWLLEGIGPEQLEEAEGFSFDDICIPIPSLDDSQKIDIEFDPSFIISNLKAEPKKCRSWVMPDSSMQGTYNKGDTVLVELDNLNGSGDFVIKVNDSFTMRRIEHEITGAIKLISTEKEIELSPVEFEKLNIIGRVIWSGGRS